MPEPLREPFGLRIHVRRSTARTAASYDSAERPHKRDIKILILVPRYRGSAQQDFN